MVRENEIGKDPLKGKPQIVSVRILVAGYDSTIGFNVPKAAALAIGVKSGAKKKIKKVWVTITNSEGRCIFAGPAVLKSGNEVYCTLETRELATAIEGEPRLWIEVSKRYS